MRLSSLFGEWKPRSPRRATNSLRVARFQPRLELLENRLAPSVTTLLFDAAVPSTLTDTNGLGTGFTHRLPATGSSISTNDPGLNMLSNPGRLSMESTYADVTSPSGAVNLDQYEAPAIPINIAPGQDFAISASFKNVVVPNLSDQLMLFVGTSATNLIRTGFHNGNRYFTVEDHGFVNVLEPPPGRYYGDTFPYYGGTNAFNAGDDIDLTLSRTSLHWQLSCNNLTHPSLSGSSPLMSLPAFDGATTLYGGTLIASPTPTAPHFIGQMDQFSVGVSDQAPPATFDLTMAAATPWWQSQPITVTARNVSGEVVTGFTGTIQLTSSDPYATLPASYTFTAADHGTHTFAPVSFSTPGTHTVTVTYSAIITATASILVNQQPVTVQTSSDAVLHTGRSLRDAIALVNAHAAHGFSGTIDFDPSLNGATIVLTPGHQLDLVGVGGTIAINVSALRSPITIDGNFQTRIFQVNANVRAEMDNLILKNGMIPMGGPSDGPNGPGGGILNRGMLTLNHCTLTGNSANDGGNGNPSEVGGGGICNTSELSCCSGSA